MIIEYAQLLSTAHRVLDGTLYKEKSPKGMTVKRFRLNDNREENLYKACHINHPSAIWVRESKSHYKWLYELYLQCCYQYTDRYKKFHKTEYISGFLSTPPYNIADAGWSDPPPAMPDKYKVTGDSIQSYRNYYRGDKVSFAKWTSPSSIPEWFIDNANVSI